MTTSETQKFVDLGVTVPKDMRELIERAAERQGNTITGIVRLALNREHAFLLSLAYPEVYMYPQERS